MSVKFAVQIENQFGYNWDQIKEIIQKTEEHGYHSFYICDHFFLDADSAERSALEAWTVLTAGAMITERINLGTLVTGNNYRNPAMLAKIAASLYHMSNGRMEFGIGAGWKEIEYNAYGYDFPSVKDRLDMLEESIQIIKKMWSEPSASFEGKHYNIENAFCAPRPEVMPLVMIGGGGEKRTLKMVAKYADYCNLFGFSTPLEDINRKLNALKNHASGVERDFDDIGKSLFTSMWVSESQEEVDEYLGSIAKRGNSSMEELKERLYPSDMDGGWIGTPEQVKERIEFMQGLGFDYFFFQQPFDVTTTTVESFAELVMNKHFK